ncbi:VirK/YbjX family protein [Photobacterium leiognathi]|uniref:VirK/YbjX family protein n=1 Tax=Photobacterium leiognathi TaxID=553611 RepID=UPI0027323F0A|nr:VirK/YbjX family protein [Photobacterium leiognathi]
MSIIKSAKLAYSDKKRGKALSIAKYAMRAMLYSRQYKELSQYFSETQRKEVLEQQPEFLMRFTKPYLATCFSKNQIVDVLKKHYRWMEDHFSEEARHTIYSDELELYSFTIDEKNYQVKLSFDHTYRREGELALLLTDSEGNRYYAIAFTVVDNDIYIGCMQGGNNDNGFSRLFTKAIFGLRPKSFMVETLRLFANDMGIDHIYAVKNSAHVYMAKRYGKKGSSINLNYDQLWQEHNGEEHDESFYSLPLHTERRAMEDIKRPKRKMYRERYAWLDEYDQALKEKLDAVSVIH